MINLNLNANQIIDFPDSEAGRLNSLVAEFQRHQADNYEKSRYYEGNIPLSEVNLGIALPENMGKLEIGCAWGAKTVDVLAARSMFDGFVGANGESVDRLVQISLDNNLIAEYMKACRDELKLGCSFATLSADDEIGCKIRFHSPMSATAQWNGAKGRIDCGLAIIDTQQDTLSNIFNASRVNYYTDDYVYELILDGTVWTARAYRHRMGRPLMEPLIWNATTDKPFGRSRIKEPIRRLIQGYVRTIANATIGLEFATSPQKYLLGVSDEQFDAVVNNKFRQYVGSILTSTNNPDNGEKPSFGQLQQGNISPHVEMIRVLATQFSAATGLSVTDTGVVNDANPTSSEAIIAQTQTLITLAEQLNEANGNSLRIIALMALAIVNQSSIDELTDEQKDVIAHFKNPAMPSVAATADAALKIASVREGFSQTDTFLEMIGFDQADIRRIKAQERMIQGMAVLTSLEGANE